MNTTAPTAREAAWSTLEEAERRLNMCPERLYLGRRHHVKACRKLLETGADRHMCWRIYRELQGNLKDLPTVGGAECR